MTLAENQSKLSDLTETHLLSWSTQQSKFTKFSFYRLPQLKCKFRVTFGTRDGFCLLGIPNIWWCSEMKVIQVVVMLALLGNCWLFIFTFYECHLISCLLCCLGQDCAFFQCSPPFCAHLKELWSREHQGLLHRPAWRILRGQALFFLVFK